MRLIALLMAAALLFAGCTEEKPREPGPTPKPSSTATVPPMPAEANEETVGGAAAFVKHYIDVLNYASNTGDVKELQKLSDPKCEGCTEYIEHFQTTYAAGGYFKDSGWKIRRSEIADDADRFGVLIAVDAPRTKFKTNSSSEEKIGESGRYELFLKINDDLRVQTFERVER